MGLKILVQMGPVIADVDKCHLDECCLDKSYIPSKFHQNRVSNSCNITDMDRTYDAWTNVTVTVGICSRCSLEAIFKA